MGHLSGIITGTLQLYGFFDIVFLPSESSLNELDECRGIRWLTRFPTFVPTPSHGLSREPSALRRDLGNGLCSACTFGRSMMESIKLIIFGHGAALNGNIQLPSWTSSGHTLGRDEDENWSGVSYVNRPVTESQIV
jgi:hypothetical protein